MEYRSITIKGNFKKSLMKIGIVGTGNWGKKIIKKLRELGCQIKIIKRKDSFIKEAANLNTIFIVTDDNSHFKFLNLIKNTNKKIFCEKPLTRNINELKKIKKFGFKNIFVSDIANYYPNYKVKNENYIFRSKIDRGNTKNLKKRFDLLYRFFYHDLSYLLHRFKNLKVKKIKIINSKKYLEFVLKINSKFFHFTYVTDKKKKYTFNGKSLYSGKDNLKKMLKTFLKGNFHSKNNFKKAIKISQIIEIVRRKILEN